MKAPAFDRYRITLRLTAPARFHFLHGAVVRGLLSRALADHELPEGVIPATPESGRTTRRGRRTTWGPPSSATTAPPPAVSFPASPASARGPQTASALPPWAATSRSRPPSRSTPRTWRRQPPPDPVNAMLSFGYTLLYNHASTALTVAGLNPRIGLLHEGRGRHHALASDLVEEMRWLVDALVWSVVSRSQVKAEDFTVSPDGRYPCWMTRDFRGRFLGYFEDRLHTAFSPAEGERTTYRAHLADQARQVARLVRGEIGVYQPLRLTA